MEKDISEAIESVAKELLEQYDDFLKDATSHKQGGDFDQQELGMLWTIHNLAAIRIMITDLQERVADLSQNARSK